MNYQQTLDWLFQQLPMYQRQGRSAYKADLSNTIKLDDHLGNPHKKFKSIHVAGTNGKGSTCHMLASILQEAGFKVGLYTSPHLKDFRERIKINGKMCPQEFVVDFVETHKGFIEGNRFSFFELTVGMAYAYFAQEKVDVAVIEVGMGGRLDSTNIITPVISVITSIDRDHVAILGNTLTKIAGEKAGIIKENIPVVVGERRGHLRVRFRESALSRNAPLHLVDHRESPPDTDLKGIYQRDNARTARKTIEVIKEVFQVDEASIHRGFQNVAKNTGLKGRFQKLSSNPTIIADTAHNPAGIKLVFKQVSSLNYDKLFLVVGVVNDKEVSEIAPLLPKTATYFIARPDVPRGMPVEEFSTHLSNAGIQSTSFKSIPEALEAARNASSPKDLILVTGSTFVVAEVV